MRHSRYKTVLLLCTFLFGFSLIPATSWAEEATPTSQRGDSVTEFCTADEISQGDASIKEWPTGGAAVNPTSSPGMDLYVVEVTLPKDSCLSFTGHYLHDGAIVWLVKSGEVSFAFEPIDGWPAADLIWEMQTPDPQATDWSATLEAGDWVTADRATEYSYLAKSGGEDGNAVVIMTVLEKRVTYNRRPHYTFDSNRCKGVCRR